MEVNVKIHIEECCVCGMLMGFSERTHQEFLKTKDLFFCPRGHRQQYIKSLAEQHREALAAKDAQLIVAQREKAELAEKLLACQRKQKKRKKAKKAQK